MSILLERDDFAGVLAARRLRLRWVAPTVLLFLAVTLLFPREILSLYPPAFAAEGTGALRILAVSTAFTVLFALAPTFLKFQQRNRLLYGAMAGVAALQAGLIVVLVPPLGAVGAATAHALCLIGLYGTFAVLGHREARRRSA